MAQSEPSENGVAPTGTAENARTQARSEVQQRLLLWAKRQGRGLARLEYSSEFDRAAVVAQLRHSLTQAGVPLTEIQLSRQDTAAAVVADWLEQLAQVSGGVVSVSGFAAAFQTCGPLEDALRVVNFNREALVGFPLRQIWWMPPRVVQVSLHAMPDLFGWFNPRLHLEPQLLPSTGQTLPQQLAPRGSGTWSNWDDAHRRSRQLLEQFAIAKQAGASDQDLLVTYLLPALESLAEVGAQKELQALTTQFSGILGTLKLSRTLEIASSLDCLASLYKDQGRYGEAEPLYQQALKIRKAELGDRHPSTATSLNNLAGLYYAIGRYGEAEPLYTEALEICKVELGDRHPDTASSLNNLAWLYKSMERFPEAVKMMSDAVSIREEVLGPEHPYTIGSRISLAAMQRDMEGLK